MNIYEKLKKPIIGLSPMEDVTDTVFRRIVMSLSKPDLLYTEFVNVDGLNSVGKDRVMHRLEYDSSEHPIIAQLWGNTPKNFLKSAMIVKDLGFDGIDINMGCSVKNVINGLSGSALITADRELVKEIIDSVKESGLPISVKTRLGFNSIDMDWIYFLLDQNLSVLTIHMRTARGASSINADWSYMNEIVNLRNSISPNTLIFGNGDIHSIQEANEKISEYMIDGVLIGRAAMTNPWCFSKSTKEISINEKIAVFKNHLKLFDDVWGKKKDFNSLKKFFRAYINGFDGASELRAKLMQCNSSNEVIYILDQLLVS